MNVLVLDGNENQAVACTRALARAGHRVTRWSGHVLVESRLVSRVHIVIRLPVSATGRERLHRANRRPDRIGPPEP